VYRVHPLRSRAAFSLGSLTPELLAGALALTAFGLGACAGDEGRTTGSAPLTGVAGDGDGDTPSGGDGDASGNGSGTGDGDGDGDDTERPLGPDECAAIRQDAPEGRGGVDVIMLLDTSGSMLHATTQVVNNLSKFIEEFEGTQADTRVVMITGSDPAAGTPVASDMSRYRFLKSTVDSGALFSVALASFPLYQDFLRPNAATQFVMITDDEDNLEPGVFRSEMEKLLGHEFTQHAIASENQDGHACISEAQKWNPLCVAPIPAVCAAAAIGERYYTLAEQTSGETMSICKEDWSEVFSKLKEAVIAAVPLPCDYPLADAIGEDFDSDKVSVVYSREKGEDEFGRASDSSQCADKLGWYYDNPEAPTSISLCPAACEAVQQGGSIDFGFGCPPIIIF
jgi:hypothetical protein